MVESICICSVHSSELWAPVIPNERNNKLLASNLGSQHFY
jgi:hypothetical protein